MRTGWIDSWRGILILLVVVGHIIGMSYHFANIECQKTMGMLYKLIYSFHMPAFFLLAGMTWSGQPDGFRAYLEKKIKRLAVPYLFWGFVSAGIYVLATPLIKMIFSGATTDAYVGKGMERFWLPFVSILHGGGWPDGNGFQCNSVLWFLPVMFSLLIMFFVIHKVFKSRLVLITFLVAAFPVWFALQHISWPLPWGLSLVWRYLPYFIVGFLVKDLRRIEFSGKAKRVVWFVFIALVPIHLFACVATPDMHVATDSILWAFLFFLIALAGAFGSAFGSILLDNPLLRSIGKETMVIMIFHKFIILMLMNVTPLSAHLKYLGLSAILLHGLLITAATIVICRVMHHVFSKHIPRLIGEWK